MMSFDEIGRHLQKIDEFNGRHLEPRDDGLPLPPLSAYASEQGGRADSREFRHGNSASLENNDLHGESARLPTPFAWRDPSGPMITT